MNAALLACTFVAAFLLLAIWVVTVMGYNSQDRDAPNQPVPFSRKHHVSGLGLDCRYCHANVETSSNAGMPSTKICTARHSRIWTNAAMLAPDRLSRAEDKPIRWTRVYRLPDHVYFGHSIQVAKGVGCKECHGPIGGVSLTWKANTLYMGWCLSCHRNPAPHLRPEDAVLAGPDVAGIAGRHAERTSNRSSGDRFPNDLPQGPPEGAMQSLQRCPSERPGLRGLFHIWRPWRRRRLAHVRQLRCGGQLR